MAPSTAHLRGSENGNRWSPTGREVLTYSGVMIDVTCPRPEQIKLGDIAVSLSQQVRFTGHCPLRPTIAEHSLAVEHIALKLVPDEWTYTPGELQQLGRAALMHDAGEYLDSDINGAVKKEMRPVLRGVAARNSGRERGQSVFDKLEAAAMAAIEARFDCAVPHEWHGLIHQADMLACAYEMAWGDWCTDAKPPLWVVNDPYVRRCYRRTGGGGVSFVARARALGMS